MLRVSLIIIGRNEGERLVRCLQSIKTMRFEAGTYEVIYADSNSDDGSMQRAKNLGARAYCLDSERPTAARGRNLGLRHARAPLVFFLDGDTVVAPDFLARAVAYLDDHPEVAVVWGHRREMYPQHSVYNRVLDLDWIYPPGESAFCGGDAVMRRSVLEEVGPFDPELIAGEEPELCSRIRAAGYKIMHLDVAMTGHDLAMTRFSGYWRRCFRAGHAYAEVARHTGGAVFGRDSRRNHLQMAFYVLGPAVVIFFFRRWSPVVLGGGALLLLLRTVWRARRRGASPATTLLYALHSHFCHPIIWLGQMFFHLNLRRRRSSGIIEYK